MSAVFDGSTTYLSRSTDLVGLSNSKKGTVAGWIKRGAAGAQTLLSGDATTEGFNILWTAGNLLQITGYNAASSKILDIASSAITSTTAWVHFMASWDLSATTTHLYIDNADDNTETTATDDTIDYTRGEWNFGATSGGSSFLDAKVYDFIFWPGTYVDLSDTDNRKLLVSFDGVSISATKRHIRTIPSGVKPVGYGHDASFPTGTRPHIYLSGTWRQNRGTGGPFTLQGSFGDVTSSDPDIPNSYRLASRGGTVGERWFDSEKSGMSAPRSETFIERRPGHPDFGKRLRTRYELDEHTRDLDFHRASFARLLRPNEEDTEDIRR